MLSAYRKGYSEKRLESEDREAEITATIDEQNKVTDIEINGNELNNIKTVSKDKNSITGNAVLETESKNISENKFTALTTDENEIINKIQEKTNFNKEKIRRAIKFKYKEPEYKGNEKEEYVEEVKTAAQAAQPNYMTKVNGSVIIRLG